MFLLCHPWFTTTLFLKPPPPLCAVLLVYLCFHRFQKKALGQTPCMTLCISALFPHRSFTGFFAFTNFPLHPLTFVEATCAQFRNYTANQRRVSPSLCFNALKATQPWTNTLETRVKWRFTCKIPMSLGDFAALHVSNWDSKIGQIFAAVPSWLWPLVQHNESAARKMEKNNNERIEQHGTKHRETWNRMTKTTKWFFIFLLWLCRLYS